jgi:HlyD family secretion protein
MRKRWIVILAVLIAVCLGVLATGAFRNNRAQDQETERLYTVERGDLRVTVRETGTVEPFSKVEVKGKVGGRILRLVVEEGQQVRQGDLIAQIDPIETQSQVNQIRQQIAAAQARLEQAETQLQLQAEHSPLGVADAEQALHSAQARLQQARRQSEAQPSLTSAAIDQAEASYRSAQASLDALLQSTHPRARADARSGLIKAKADVENAERELRRMKELQKKGFVPDQSVDQAQRTYDNVNAERDSAQERVNTLDQQLAAEERQARQRVEEAQASLKQARANEVQTGLKQDDLEAAQAECGRAQVAFRRAKADVAQVKARQADVQAAKAEVQRLKDSYDEVAVRLNDTTIRAPMSGTVTRRYVEVGELIQSGISTFSSGTPIVQIADLSRMRVVCQVNEVDVAHVQVGQRADVLLDAARGERYRGRVVSVAPAAGTGTPGAGGQGGGQGGGGAGGGIVKFQVKIAVEQSDGRLKPGMSANVDIVTAERKGVLTLPLEALDFGEPATEGERPKVKANPNRAKAILLRGKGPTAKTKTVTVTTGLKNETVAEIVSGLREGDQVEPAEYRGVPRKGFQMQVGAQAGGDGE